MTPTGSPCLVDKVNPTLWVSVLQRAHIFYDLSMEWPPGRHNFRRPLLASHMALQDKDSIYFLTEAVTGSEMWSIVYEGASGYAEGELPIEHGRYFLSKSPGNRYYCFSWVIHCYVSTLFCCSSTCYCYASAGCSRAPTRCCCDSVKCRCSRS